MISYTKQNAKEDNIEMQGFQVPVNYISQEEVYFMN